MLNTGWDVAEIILRGLLSCLGLGVAMFIFALISLRTRTRLK